MATAAKQLQLFLPGLLQGAGMTLRDHRAGGCLLAVGMATLAALLRLYGPAPLRWLAVGYVEFFRGTSALVQLFWLFFVLPNFGISLDPFPVAVLGLGLNIGAYGAEVVRGAIQGGAARPVGGDHRPQHEPLARRCAGSSCRRPSSR
jgi:polar amino acid transport system permease protein